MNSKKPFKKMSKPILISNPRYFATSRSAHRAYKYFSSISLYQSSHKPRDQRFEGLFGRIKYIKKFNVPMIVGVSNSNQLIKRIKFLSKTMTHSSNILSYLLSKGKQTLTLAEYHKRTFRASQSISETFLQNFCSLEGLRYLPNLKTLKLWGNSRNLPKLEEKFYDLLPDLKKLRHLYAYGIKLDKLFSNPKALSNLYSLHSSNVLPSRFKTCDVEKLRLKQLDIQDASSNGDFISFLDDLPVIGSLKQIIISTRQSLTSKTSKAKIEEFLAKYGLTLSPAASQYLDEPKPESSSTIIEDDKYSLKMHTNLFTFTIKS